MWCSTLPSKEDQQNQHSWYKQEYGSTNELKTIEALDLSLTLRPKRWLLCQRLLYFHLFCLPAPAAHLDRSTELTTVA